MKGEKVWILDTRHELTFGSGHVKGSVNIGLNGTFALWVGAVIPTDVHLLLVTEPGKEQESILRLARVGYEKILGYLDGGIEAWKSAGEPVAVVNTISAEEFEKQFNADNKASIIDVRKKGEFGTAHLTTANHVCLSEVAKRMSEFDKTQKHYVHCAGGYRSMIAVSMMQKEGFTNLINIDGGFSAISKTNMPVAVEEGVSCS
jgi:rhodanese-related sulfurtransferase